VDGRQTIAARRIPVHPPDVRLRYEPDVQWGAGDQWKAKDQTGSWGLRHPCADRDDAVIQQRNWASPIPGLHLPVPAALCEADHRRPFGRYTSGGLEWGGRDDYGRQSGGVRQPRPVTRPRSFPTAVEYHLRRRKAFDSVPADQLVSGDDRSTSRIQRHVARRHRAGPRQAGPVEQGVKTIGSAHTARELPLGDSSVRIIPFDVDIKTIAAY